MALAPLHFLSPDRPRISGLPAFRTEVNPGGLSIIPGLYCHPNNDGTIELSGFFSSGSNRSTRKAISIPESAFADFWARWLADPEGTAERDFGWTPLPQGATPAPVKTLDLDDLLGDF